MPDVVFLGPPGSGKGTQAARVASARGWVHLSTGDLFRRHLRERTPLGALAHRYIDEGRLVPDSVTVDMVRERLGEVPAATPIVFDGFPRTVAQADALDALLAERGRSLGRVLILDVPRETLVARIAGRAKSSGRTDETPEVVARRLDVYASETAPLVAHYDERGLLIHVDGTGSVDAVDDTIARVLP